MPPLAEVVDALTHVVLPASAATAIVFLIVVLLTHRCARDRRPVAAAALAVLVGFVAGNHLRGAVEFRIDSEQSLTPAALATAVRDTFVPPESDDAPLPPPSRYWLPWTAGLALLGGLAARRLPCWAAWLLRIAITAFATALIVPADLRDAVPWFAPLFLAVMLAEWFVLERPSRRREPASEDDRVDRRLLPDVVGCAAFLAASIVLLHAHSARFVDIATIAAACLGTLAVLAALTNAGTDGTAPGVAVLLPGLMFVGHQDTFSDVPTASFVLTAVAPLAMGLLLVPRLGASRFAAPLAIAMVAALLAGGVALAMRAESLSFG